jgi:hypothetical protein
MRIYLELIEALEEAAAEEADFIRIDVTEWSKDDIDAAINLLLDQAQAYGHYTLQKHYCGHEEGEPCYAEVIAQR